MPTLIEEQSRADNDGVSNHTFTLGGSVQVGDLVLLIQLDNFYTLANLDTPSGTGVTTWTEQTANGLPLDLGTNQHHGRVWTGTVTTAGGTVIGRRATNLDDEGYAQILVFRDGEFDTGDVASGGGTSDPAPSVIPTSGKTDDWLVCTWGNPFAGPGNYTVPGSMTPLTERDIGGASYRTAYEVLASDSATGTRTATYTVSDAWAAISVLIKSVAAAPPTGPFAQLRPAVMAP
jgi:hypothetical protein